LIAANFEAASVTNLSRKAGMRGIVTRQSAWRGTGADRSRRRGVWRARLGPPRTRIDARRRAGTRIVDGPPGADEMPADPGLVVVVPTGGTPPMPGATPPAPAAAPAFCANAEEAAVTRNIVSKAERCNLCRMRTFPSGLLPRQRLANPGVRILAFLPLASPRHHIVVAHDD
jgi:hypothetical protein